MAQDDFERFRIKVLQDLGLQKQLWDIENREAFMQQVVKLGQANGYSFSLDDVNLAMQASRRAWIERGLG